METGELIQAIEKAKEKIKSLILDFDDISKKFKLEEKENAKK